MRHRILSCSLFLVLLALAACGSSPVGSTGTGTPTSTPSPAISSTPSPTPSPMPTPPVGFLLYTNAALTYQIAYPNSWTILNNKTQIEFTGGSQLFEVSMTSVAAGVTPAQIVNSYCQAMQKGVAPDPARTTTVSLAGQSWTRATCDAGVQGAAIGLVVEVVIYQGATYQIDYTSPIVEFSRDTTSYYIPMERSFRFLK